MPATTPPKGRPTAGRADRTVAQRRQRSRATTKKFIWGVVALSVLVALLVLGSGTGGNANVGGTTANLALPGLLTLRWSTRRPGRRPRS